MQLSDNSYQIIIVSQIDLESSQLLIWEPEHLQSYSMEKNILLDYTTDMARCPFKSTKNIKIVINHLNFMDVRHDKIQFLFI